MNRILASFLVALSVLFYLVPLASASDVVLAEAPTSSEALTLGAIESAKQSIRMNIYQFESPELADAIIARIRAGVTVDLLEEGQPVGGFAASQSGLENEIVQAMKTAQKGHFYLMSNGISGTPGYGKKRRYAYDHAKYTLVDDNAILIGSENYTPTGNPLPGTLGNRGWEVFIYDSSLTAQYKQVFLEDSSTSYGDVTEMTGNKADAEDADALFSTPLFSETAKRGSGGAAPSPSHGIGNLPVLTSTALQQITSPNTSQQGLLAAINGAKTSLDIEQMTFNSAWYNGTSPLLTAVIAAAKRGVHVRVLLNDENAFNDDPPGSTFSSSTSRAINVPTMDLLNAASENGKYPIEARIANIQAMNVDYIHNKGLLADGTKTLISSINWGANSVLNNREAAVLITSGAINAHYEALFNQDWTDSPVKPATEITTSPGRRGRVAINNEFSETDSVPVDCPSSLHLVVQVGALNLSDEQDKDFSKIANTTIASDFVQMHDSQGCVLEGDFQGSSVAGKDYLQISGTKNGVKSLVLEGYTPNTHKLFSIRAKMSLTTDVFSQFDASVYDGSDASRERLGSAQMNLTHN